jgi:hypothetical protein
MKKRTVKILALLLMASLALSSCKLLRGDPRKNCNHPKHGEYMMQKRMGKMKKQGLGL